MAFSAEQKEIVFSYYQMSLDIDIAGLKAGLDENQVFELKEDEEFLMRCKLEDAQLQEELITSTRSLLGSQNDGVKLSAIKELGRIFYEKKFTEKKATPNEKEIPVNIFLKGRSA